MGFDVSRATWKNIIRGGLCIFSKLFTPYRLQITDEVIDVFIVWEDQFLLSKVERGGPFRESRDTEHESTTVHNEDGSRQ